MIGLIGIDGADRKPGLWVERKFKEDHDATQFTRVFDKAFGFSLNYG